MREYINQVVFAKAYLEQVHFIAVRVLLERHQYCHENFDTNDLYMENVG